MAISTADSTKVKKPSTAEILFYEANTMGLQPAWIARPGGIFGIQVDGAEAYINFARSPLNSHTSASLAKNKYITRCLLERHEMNNVPFIRTSSQDEAAAFLGLHSKIIAKPIGGSGSKDIHIIETTEALLRLDIDAYILEKYIVGQEYRYLVLDNQVIAVHRSDYGGSVASDRPLKRISYPADEWDEELCAFSLHALHILGLRFAAVDFIVDAKGRAFALEINSAPGLKWFHEPTSGPAVDVASRFLMAVVTQHTHRSEHRTTETCVDCTRHASVYIGEQLA